jgi:hypothetical protein
MLLAAGRTGVLEIPGNSGENQKDTSFERYHKTNTKWETRADGFLLKPKSSRVTVAYVRAKMKIATALRLVFSMFHTNRMSYKYGEKLCSTSQKPHCSDKHICPLCMLLFSLIQSNARQTFVKTDELFSSLKLAPARLALGVRRSGRGEGGLGRDFRNIVEGLAVGFPDCMIRSLSVEETANSLVVEEFGATVDEGVLEAGDVDLGGL